MKRTIEDFNPDVKVMNFAEHQDFLKAFNAGDDYFGFNEFVRRDAWDDTLKGEGVTYLVFNTIGDGKKEYKELVAYYTLSVTAIPYIDRIRLDEEERKETGKEFDEETYAIPAIEIKIFG